MAATNTRVYALAVVAAVVLATIVITGLNTFGYATNAQGTASLLVTGSVMLSAPTSTVNLGALAPSATNNTLGGNPPPFVLQNDGNVKVNITINATDLFSTAANPTGNYTYNANTSAKGTCFYNTASESIITPTNVPAVAGVTKFIGMLNYTDSCDTAEVEIAVSVPSGEPTGAKSSTVGFTASQG